MVYSQQKQDIDKGDINDKKDQNGLENHIYYLKIGQKSYPIKYSIEGGSIQNITIVDRNTIEVFLKTLSDGSFTIEIPKNLVGKQIDSLLSSLGSIFGSDTDIKELRIFTFDFENGTKSMTIEGIVRVPNSLIKNLQNINTLDKNKEADANDIVSYDNSGPFLTNLTIDNIPQFIWLNDPGYDYYNLTLRAFIQNDSINFKDDYEKSSSLVSDWNPIMEFEIPPTKYNIGFINIKNMVIGKIKNYEDLSELFKEIQYWKNIPLSEEIVLRLNLRGQSFIIAELEFSNGDSALYGAGLEIDASGTKSDAYYWFKQDRPEDIKKIVKETKTSKSFENDDKNFWIASQQSICKILTSNGFNTCID